MRQQTRRLTSLIDDLLLLAQADSGRITPENETINLSDLVRAALDDLDVLCSGKNIRQESDIPNSLTVRADRRLISMVIQNLVENAAKYTRDGGSIRVTAGRDGIGVFVRVGNSGETISDEEAHRIFDRFRRGSSMGGHVAGHGLGLNIARELARVHGGDLILVKSNEQNWVEFELHLPSSADAL